MAGAMRDLLAEGKRRSEITIGGASESLKAALARIARVTRSVGDAVVMEVEGEGAVRDVVQRALTRVMKLHPGVREVRVVLNADVLDRLKKEDEEILIDLERKFQGRLSFRVNAKFHFEEFKLVNALTDEELS